MADFKTAFLFTLQHEDSTRSGKVTVDAGGRTRFGIAEKFHPDLPEEFFTGPAEDALAEAEKIEEREYWDACVWAKWKTRTSPTSCSIWA